MVIQLLKYMEDQKRASLEQTHLQQKLKETDTQHNQKWMERLSLNTLSEGPNPRKSHDVPTMGKDSDFKFNF